MAYENLRQPPGCRRFFYSGAAGPHCFSEAATRQTHAFML